MKIAVCGDVHWSQYSSILRGNSLKYSIRLENLINSVNWFNRLAEVEKCKFSIFLGDFFDKADLTAIECSALNEIIWPNMDTYFLCGNHEMASVHHEHTSASIFDLLQNGKVIKNTEKIYTDDSIEIIGLPYILENNREPLEKYLKSVDYNKNKKHIIFSHNDINGIQYGGFLSKSGFSIEEIEKYTDKFINGHLHNGSQITKKIINIGNLSGANFSEDATEYDHVVFIIDTDTLNIDVYENPYAFNFYKLDATINKVNLDKLKSNSVITLKCFDKDAIKYKEKINSLNNIIESRVIIDFSQKELNENINQDNLIQELSVDHISEFKKFIIESLGNNEIVLEELEEVCI